MLQVTIQGKELFDESKQEFITAKSETIQLEHSLVSLSKWESKWCKPFLGKDKKTTEETIDYIRCMTINKNVPDNIYYGISDKVFDRIAEYIRAPMTATWFNEQQSSDKKNKEVITSEIIYYWMIAQNIPMECQKWHLERLLTLINVCRLKNAPPKKMGKREMLQQRHALNKARREKTNTKG